MRWGTIAAALVLAGAANAQTPQDRDIAATKAYVFCLVDLANRFDDHQSDAATIAHAIEGGCRAELDSQVDADMALDPKVSDPRIREVTEQAAMDSRFSAALKAVLYERKHHIKR